MDLFNQSKEIIKQVGEIIVALDDIKKNTFNEYLKTKKMIGDFVLNTNTTLGKIKENTNLIK